jgi:hypothetical protein
VPYRAPEQAGSRRGSGGRQAASLGVDDLLADPFYRRLVSAPMTEAAAARHRRQSGVLDSRDRAVRTRAATIAASAARRAR